jgi:hypothetical protein
MAATTAKTDFGDAIRMLPWFLSRFADVGRSSAESVMISP